MSCVIDVKYEVLNGLIGLNKRVLLKLLGFMDEKLSNIRIIFGVDGEVIGWRNHSIFLSVRKGYLKHIPLLPNADAIVTQTPVGEKCNIENFGTVFLDHTISEDIFRWTFQIAYSLEKQKEICFGAAGHKRAKGVFCYRQLYWTDMTYTFAGSYCLHFTLETNGTSSCSFFGSWNRFDRKDGSLPLLPNNSTVSIEADADQQTLSYFINGKKVHYVAKLPKGDRWNHGFPIKLGISGMAGVSFTSLSFRRLESPTPSPVECTVFAYQYIPPMEID